MEVRAEVRGAAPSPAGERATAPESPPYWADVVEERLNSWRQQQMNRSGDRLALDDFMGQDSIDDLIDFVCAPIPVHPAAQPAAPSSSGSHEEGA